jgi:imidazolonepropionase-like amidohydrolase
LCALGAAVVSATMAVLSTARAGQDTVVIRHITVLPMTTSQAVTGQTVVVSNGRIAALGPDGQVTVPRGATELDGTGRYLIPGLIEMHAHTSKTRASALGLYVVHGVTTIRDQGSEHAEVLRWRNEIRSGLRIGPRMLIAGPYLESLRNIERMRRDPPEARVEPFERARIGIGSPEAARRIVDSLAVLELDHLKVRTVQDEETYLALGAAAASHGLRLVGHVATTSPDVFLASGQLGVDHIFPIGLQSLPREQRMSFWRELAARDIGVVPTLVSATESIFQSAEYFESLVNDTTATVHRLRPYLSRFLVLDWREQAEEATQQRRAMTEQAWPIILGHIREMRESGVRIMAGSDVGVLNVFPGASLHEELRLFVDSIGMSPLEALASATRAPAEWLGLADSLGTIEVGKVADLVLLDADPREDITNTRRIAAVLARGRLFQRRDLDALLEAVAAMPDQRVNDWVR